jgi:DTW domain-containing protein
VLIIQHPNERGHPKSSTPLLQRSLARCSVINSLESQSPRTQVNSSIFLLYPDLGPMRGTADQRQEMAHLYKRSSELDRPYPTLLLIDGTWRNSRMILHHHPELRQLPRVSFPSYTASLLTSHPQLTPPDIEYGLPSTSSYRTLRKARSEGLLSTLEAACTLLSWLESAPHPYAQLLYSFEEWVTHLLSFTPHGPQRSLDGSSTRT